MAATKAAENTSTDESLAGQYRVVAGALNYNPKPDKDRREDVIMATLGKVIDLTHEQAERFLNLGVVVDASDTETPRATAKVLADAANEAAQANPVPVVADVQPADDPSVGPQES